MRNFLAKVSLFIFLNCIALQAQPKDLFLLIGQSNMSGRATIEAIDTATLKGVSLLDSLGQWIPAKNPLNLHSTVRKEINMQKLGPGYTFAKKLAQQQNAKPIGLIVNARGGTSSIEWLPDTILQFPLYNEAVRRAKQGIASGGQLKAIIWHQGETDIDYNLQSQHLKNIKKIVAGIRKDLNLPNLPFIAGEVGKFKTNAERVNSIIRMFPDSIPYSTYVSSDNLGNMDSNHFNSTGQRTLGERYADAYIKMSGSTNTRPYAIYKGANTQIENHFSIAGKTFISGSSTHNIYLKTSHVNTHIIYFKK